MGRKDHTSRRGDHGSPSDPAPLGNPLDFIQEDHLREREICNLIVRIAEAEQPDPDDISVVASFFSHELPPHLADEEQGLIHLLARRCRPEDEIGPLIARLDADRREAREEMAGLLALLNGAGADGFAFGDDNRARLRRYAARARRQLILEYAIILPFARLRLTAADLDALRRDMLARRGLDQLMEGKK
jgi:hypothetical protein